MNKNKIIKIIGLALNLTIFVATLIVVIRSTIYGYSFGKTQFPGGVEFFKFFTNLSNIYAALVAIVLFVYDILHFKDDKPLPRYLSLIALGAATAVGLTFLTVVFFLAPTVGIAAGNYWLMFANEMLFTHALTPIMFCVVFIFISKHERINNKEALFGIIPMVIYAFFYIVFYFTGVWTDFYGFTFGGHWWAVFIVLPIMLCVTYLISWLLSFSTRRRQK